MMSLEKSVSNIVFLGCLRSLSDVVLARAFKFLESRCQDSGRAFIPLTRKSVEEYRKVMVTRAQNINTDIINDL